MSLAIVYGSSMGNTENAASLISEKLGIEADVLDVANTNADAINTYDKLICGTSTWSNGDMQDDWDSFDFGSLKLSGKTVAVFGVGDSQGYSDEFCNGMAKLFNELKNAGANLVGEISTDGYSFDESEALNNKGNFVGLALDYDNEEEMNEQRIDNWIKIIKPLFS
ncbi:flavodoxin FldA [Campylobacter ureolyticus]|uniref:flavodoxin FldA n=1 Tax=Campylobacter ureolyticus TaxID=827 RepID=UPI0022B31490|nr:flavodoxin FldA [Campylobacter ureolyticus]MCZ6155852.1 flavodoxin FldA [Campylobacter ureolyticus]